MTATIEKTTEVISFSINSKVLATAFATLGKVISTNSIVPIIENIHATTEDGVLTLRASDLKTTMITALPYTSTIGETCGVFLIPHKLSSDLLKSLPNTPITIEHHHNRSQGTYRLVFRVDKQKYTMESESPADFPKYTEVEGEVLTIPADQLREGLKYCLNAASSDDMRPAMCGVYFDSDTLNLTLASTNGHGIVLYETKVPSVEKTSFILRTGAAQAVFDIISANISDIVFSISKKSVEVSLGEYTIISQLIDERYPDYKAAVPTDYANTVHVNLNEWKVLVKRSLLFANKTTGATRNGFSDKVLRVSSEDLDYNTESDQVIEIESDREFEDLAIGINGKLFQEVTQPASGTISASFSMPNRMMLLTIPTSIASSLRIGIMPVMLLENHNL